MVDVQAWLSIVRNGDLLATKRHNVHKKFESSIQLIIRFVAFVIFFVARKNGVACLCLGRVCRAPMLCLE
jgi:hypothetical protein